MKSVGEVMGIGRCFEEALQKAVRMLDIGKIGLVGNSEETEKEPTKQLLDVLARPTDQRLFKVVKALKQGISIPEIYRLSGIDPFFLNKIQNIIDIEKELCYIKPTNNDFLIILKEAKRLGFSDKQIGLCLEIDEFEVRKIRKDAKVIPSVKQIDTLAAEWPAKTNYLYLTYGGDEDDIEFSPTRNKVMVLGAGVFRIGSSVEFDWCGVNTIWALKKNGIEEAIMVNYNPETVSTDYDMSDKLYFEELTLERILDIHDKENPLGIIASVGGQIPNNLALKLSTSGVNLLGTSGESIDKAEDRSKFSSLLYQLEIQQPQWSDLSTTRDLKKFALKVGYPILIRPSYVLSGSAMRVAYTESELENYLKLAAKVSKEHPAVISKFIENAKEVEVDGVYDGEDNIIGAIIEHVENAGVHSGDATMGIPSLTLGSDVLRTIRDYTFKIVDALKIKGPYNIQYLVKDNVIYVIECNLRASRSMPYVSKTRGVNMIELATWAMLGKKFKDIGFTDLPKISHVGVKVPQFSFMRLSGADPVLGVEMLSTGEVACIGENFTDALSKAMQSASFKMPPDGGSVLITVGGKDLKEKIIPIGKEFMNLGFKIYATIHTAEALENAGIYNISILHKVREVGQIPNIVDFIQEGKIDLVINIPMPNHMIDFSEVLKDEYTIRRLAIEFNIPVVTNLQLASALTKLLEQREANKFDIRSLNEYMDSLPRKFW
jgi:carbamoyl-phosphate synthase large subunit